MKLNILSYVYESFKFPLLWKCSFKALFWVVCLLKDQLIWVIYIFWLWSLCRFMNCQCFLQFYDLSFLLYDGIFYKQNFLILMQSNYSAFTYGLYFWSLQNPFLSMCNYVIFLYFHLKVFYFTVLFWDFNPRVDICVW